MHYSDYLVLNHHYSIDKDLKSNSVNDNLEINNIDNGNHFFVYHATIYLQDNLYENINNKEVILKELDKKRALIYEKLTNIWSPYISHVYSVYKLYVNHLEKPTSAESRYIAITEFIPGLTLEKYICSQNENRLSLNEALGLCIQLCEAINTLHCNNIIHKDIKPSNIIVEHITSINRYNIKLIDFGISELYDKNKEYLTEIGGTSGYMAPESYTSTASSKCDIYSVGCILNYMLTGYAPKEKIYEQESYIKMIIKKTINHDPYRRYSSINELNRILQYELDSKLKIKRYIPGFRTHVIWKSILASLYYALAVFLLALNIFRAELNFISLVLIVFWYLIPIVTIFDCFSIQRFVPQNIILNYPFLLFFKILLGIICFIIPFLMVFFIDL